MPDKIAQPAQKGPKMLGIYRKSFLCVRAIWPIYLGIALLQTIVPTLALGTQRSVNALAFITIGFAFTAHRYFLFGESPGKRPVPERLHGTGRFLLLGVCLFFLPYGLALWCVRLWLPNGASVEEAIRYFDIARLLLYWFFLSVFGTMLPAAAVGDDAGLRAMLARTRKTCLPIALGMLVGPFAWVVAVLGSSVFLLSCFPDILLDIRDAAETGSIPAAIIGVTLSIFLLSIFVLVPTTLAVAVLCAAYRRVVPAEEPTAATPQ